MFAQLTVIIASIANLLAVFIIVYADLRIKDMILIATCSIVMSNIFSLIYFHKHIRKEIEFGLFTAKRKALKEAQKDDS